MDSDLLKNWLGVMVANMPRGGKSTAARQLGMTPSGFSKLMSDASRQFDEKTIKCIAWMQQSKSAKYPVENYPLLGETAYNGIVIEVRLDPKTKGKFCVWRGTQ